MPDIVVLDGNAIADLLPMADCIDVMARAMTAVSGGRTVTPARSYLAVGEGVLALMPCAGEPETVYGVKLISIHRDNAAIGRPVIQGLVILFEGETGTPCALLDGAALTALRTAAVSGLATRLLARPNATSHGIFGTGVQAATHLDAVQCARPDIDHILVWGRSFEKARHFADVQARRTGLAVVPCADAREAAECDVISLVTAARDPILLGEWLNPGAHLNVVGSHEPEAREVDTRTIERARVYTDATENVLREAGDILIPIAEGRFSRERIAGEIGRLVDGSIPGRAGDNDITLFKSLGHAAQDIYAANAVYERALARGMQSISL